MRRRLAPLLLALGGCSSSTSTPTTDRLDCYGCHVSEYETAASAVSICPTKPDHVALGYSTACHECHGTAAPPPGPDPTRVRSGFCPADVKHSKFGIATGSHAGFDCADCHLAITYDPPLVVTTDPATQITCTSCHWHDQARTDPHHLGNGGYTYGPATCLPCHAGGRR